MSPPSRVCASVDVTISSSVSSEANTSTGFFTRRLFSRLYRRRKHKHRNVFETIDEDDPELHIRQFMGFSPRQLKVATRNFSRDNVVGRDEFGIAYKGKLENGTFVEVKKMRENKEQQFRREIEITSVTAHPNIINLLGFCSTGKENLLVYPYAVNRNVASILRDGRSEVPLSGIIRKKIALGTAEGLSYLHEECDPKIIHRDVKAANILLNKEFLPITCGFHLAIDSTNQIDAHVVVGTSGVIAPEYLSAGLCSEKSDVYNYGVFLLELVSGMSFFELGRVASEFDMMLVDWVRRIVEENRFEEIAARNLLYDNDDDTHAKEDNGRKVVKQLLQMYVICTSRSPEHRPKMSEVVTMLLEDGNCLAERWEDCTLREKSCTHFL